MRLIKLAKFGVFFTKDRILPKYGCYNKLFALTQFYEIRHKKPNIALFPSGFPAFLLNC